VYVMGKSPLLNLFTLQRSRNLRVLKRDYLFMRYLFSPRECCDIIETSIALIPSPLTLCSQCTLIIIGLNLI
jgi:hypothetical protein